MVVRAREHWRGLTASLVIALLPFWELLVGKRTAIYGDVIEQHLPYYAGTWRMIRDGELPWWDPSVFGGFSMVGSGSYNVFYPPNALFGWLEATNAHRWWFVLHVAFGAVGMYAWAYHRWRSSPGAVVASASFSLCGFHVFHMVHLWSAGLVWIPWAFLGMDLLAEGWTTRRALLVAVPVSMTVIGGHPQQLWITVVGLATYALVVSSRQQARWRSDLRMLSALALGCALAAIQLVPTWLFSRTSPREVLTSDAAFAYSMEPKNLLELVFPYLFGGATQRPGFEAAWRGPWLVHELMAYAGVTVLVLALVGAWARRRERSVWACAGLIVIGVVMALAGSTPAGDLIYRFVPGADTIRAWARTALLAQLAIAYLAAAGVAAVLEAPRRARTQVAAAAGAVGALALALPHIGAVRESMVPGSFGVVARLAPVLLVVLLLVAVMLLALEVRGGPAVLVIVVAVDLMTFAYAAEWRGAGKQPHEAARYLRPGSEPPFGLPFDASGGVDRWASNSLQYRSISIVAGVEGVNGYDSLIQAEFAETAGDFSYVGFPRRPDLWTSAWLGDVLRVTTLMLAPDLVPTVPGWQRDADVPGSGLVRWVRTPRLADAYLVGAVEVAGLDEIRQQLRDPTTPLRSIALVEKPLAIPLDARGSAGQVTRSAVRESGVVELLAERDALLVVSYAWMDGWHATVDGRATPVVRANGAVLGVPVPEGRHVVELRFEPPGLRVGASISALALIVLLSAARAGRLIAARAGVS